MLRSLLLNEGWGGGNIAYAPPDLPIEPVVTPPVVTPPVVPPVVTPPPVAPPVDSPVVPPVVPPVTPPVAPPPGPEVAAWRKDIAGDDDKLAGEAGRYNSPKDVLKALVAAKAALRTRAIAAPTPPAADATPEVVKAWRAENGLPDDWKGYGVEGLDKLPEDHRKTYETFLEGAHSKNLPPAAVKEAVAIYRDIEAKAVDAMVARDLAAEEATIEKLTDDWGGRVEFKRNVAMADNYLAAELGPAGPLFMKGRLADGTMIGNHPGIINMIVGQARNAGFADSFIPDSNGGGLGGVSIDDRVATIKAAMALPQSDPKSYWNDPKMREEYGRLITAREKRDAQGKKS